MLTGGSSVQCIPKIMIAKFMGQTWALVLFYSSDFIQDNVIGAGTA